MNRHAVWIPFLIVGMIVLSTWGTLHIYTDAAIHASIRSPETARVVSALAGVGNVVTVLGLLAYWPVITFLFWTIGTLLNGATPEYRDLLCAVGVALIPVAVGTFLVWSISVLDPPVDFHEGVNLKQYLQAKASVRFGQSVMIACYAGTLFQLVAAVRRLFAFSWIKAAFAVVAPLGIVCICRIWM